MKLLLAAIAASISLVGCSGGTVSATSDQAQSSSTATNSILERIKGIFKSDSKAVIIEMGLAPLVTQAVHQNLRENGLGPFIQTTSFTLEDFCFGVPEIEAVYGVQKTFDLFEYARNAVETIDAQGGPQPNWGENERINYAMFKGLKDANEHALCARLAIVKAAMPVGGWQQGIAQKSMAIAIHNAGWVTNEIEKRILSEVSGVESWKSEDELKAKINQIIDRFGTDGTLGTIYREWALGTNGGHVQIDATGSNPAPVHFTYRNSQGKNYDVTASGIGVVMSTGGGTYFGDGYIDGKKVVMRVEQTESTSMSKQSTIRDENQTSNQESQNNSSGVSN